MEDDLQRDFNEDEDGEDEDDEDFNNDYSDHE